MTKKAKVIFYRSKNKIFYKYKLLNSAKNNKSSDKSADNSNKNITISIKNTKNQTKKIKILIVMAQ